MATTHDQPEKHEQKGPFYAVEVDGLEYDFDHEPVTGGEIMDKAGVPARWASSRSSRTARRRPSRSTRSSS
jgi:hypothetical protein